MRKEQRKVISHSFCPDFLSVLGSFPRFDLQRPPASMLKRSLFTLKLLCEKSNVRQPRTHRFCHNELPPVPDSDLICVRNIQLPRDSMPRRSLFNPKFTRLAVNPKRETTAFHSYQHRCRAGVQVSRGHEHLTTRRLICPWRKQCESIGRCHCWSPELAASLVCSHD